MDFSFPRLPTLEAGFRSLEEDMRSHRFATMGATTADGPEYYKLERAAFLADMAGKLEELMTTALVYCSESDRDRRSTAVAAIASGVFLSGPADASHADLETTTSHAELADEGHALKSELRVLKSQIASRDALIASLMGSQSGLGGSKLAAETLRRHDLLQELEVKVDTLEAEKDAARDRMRDAERIAGRQKQINADLRSKFDSARALQRTEMKHAAESIAEMRVRLEALKAENLVLSAADAERRFQVSKSLALPPSVMRVVVDDLNGADGHEGLQEVLHILGANKAVVREIFLAHAESDMASSTGSGWRKEIKLRSLWTILQAARVLEVPDHSLASFDRAIVRVDGAQKLELRERPHQATHDPDKRLVLREFAEALVRVAYSRWHLAAARISAELVAKLKASEKAEALRAEKEAPKKHHEKHHEKHRKHPSGTEEHAPPHSPHSPHALHSPHSPHKHHPARPKDGSPMYALGICTQRMMAALKENLQMSEAQTADADEDTGAEAANDAATSAEASTSTKLHSHSGFATVAKRWENSAEVQAVVAAHLPRLHELHELPAHRHPTQQQANTELLTVGEVVEKFGELKHKGAAVGDPAGKKIVEGWMLVHYGARLADATALTEVTFAELCQCVLALSLSHFPGDFEDDEDVGAEKAAERLDKLLLAQRTKEQVASDAALQLIGAEQKLGAAGQTRSFG